MIEVRSLRSGSGSVIWGNTSHLSASVFSIEIQSIRLVLCSYTSEASLGRKMERPNDGF